MRLAIHLSHPSQYYVFRGIARALPQRHEIRVFYNRKDVLPQLISQEPFGRSQTCIDVPRTRANVFSSVYEFARKEVWLHRAFLSPRPDLVVGTSIFAAHAGATLRIPTVLLTDDDASVIPWTSVLAYPFCSAIIAPSSCDTGRWKKKTISYTGYQKLAYLHPDQFAADDAIVEQVAGHAPFFILRFVCLDAHHDRGARGITDRIARQLIAEMEPYGRVLLSSERELPPDLEVHRLRIAPHQLHHVLARAQLLISDSQSMSVEAALLGVPSVRFSAFAGRIGVLEELERKHRLTVAIPPSEPDRLIATVRDLVRHPLTREVYQARRETLLRECVNVAAFIADVLDRYPASLRRPATGLNQAHPTRAE